MSWPEPSTSALPTWPHLKTDAERMEKIRHHIAIGLGPIPIPWVEWLLMQLAEKDAEQSCQSRKNKQRRDGPRDN